MPQRLDWEIWRVASSDKIHASLVEIETEWTVLDLAQAHDVLDLYEVAESRGIE